MTAPTEAPTTAPTEAPTTAPTEAPTQEQAQPAVCRHNYKEATCITPKTCSKCGATEGKVAGHSFKDATCTDPKTCSKCGATEGKTAGHSFKDATCIAPKTCSKCGATEGNAAGHSWKDATCTDPKTCGKCGATEGNALGHSWTAATCTDPKTCAKCGATEGSSTGHNWSAATCTETAVCKNCGIEGETATGHSWREATCMAPKTCSRCGISQGSKTEHNWQKTVTKAPTNKEEGLLTYTCDFCAQYYTEKVSKYNFDPDAHGKADCFRTSSNPDNYVEFKISGDTLHITGKIIKSNLCGIFVQCLPIRSAASVRSQEAFALEISLSKLTEETQLVLYTRVEGESTMWGYLLLNIIPTDNGYSLERALVLDHNIEAMKKWIDPRDCLPDSVSPIVKALAESIVGNEKDDYRKLYLLQQWVAENIYYDYDFYEGKTSQLYTSAEEVYQNKRTVCAGYANLLKELVQAVGIPCITVSTYSPCSTNHITESDAKQTFANHAHVQAYLESEGRWVIMDPTWNSGNKYEDGEYIKGDTTYLYFDMSLEFFSCLNKIIMRTNVS